MEDLGIDSVRHLERPAEGLLVLFLAAFRSFHLALPICGWASVPRLGKMGREVLIALC